MADIWDLAPAVEGDVWEAAPVLGGSVPDARRAKDIGDAIIAGLKSSATGLAVEGKLPDMQLTDDAPWYHRIAAGAAGVVADLPLSIAGGVAGFAGGGAVGSAVPVVGTAAGAAVGAGAGAFAAPMALREALVSAYSNNEALSWAGVWEIAKAAMIGGTKGAVIGGATVGTGRFVAPFVAPAGKVVAGSATFGAELAALTATSAAVEQHMPTWQDFMDNAILLGGMKGATAIAKNLMTAYVETGKPPAAMVNEALKDPLMAAYLKGETKEVPPLFQAMSLDQRIKASIDADPRPELIRQRLAGETEPPKLGEVPIADPVKYEYIADRDTAKGVLRQVTAMYQVEMLKQTRGVVPNKETAAAGLRMAASGDTAAHIIGQSANAAEIYARAHLLRGATNHAVEVMGRLQGKAEADLTPAMKLEALAALERVSMLKAEVEGVGAEAGRALQIFRAMKRDPSFLGDADMLIKLSERKGSLQDIAALVATLRDPAQLHKFADGYNKATTTEKVLEAWKAAILSGPQTHLANIMGNTTKWIVELPETVLSATITAGVRAAKGDPLTMAQYKARAFAPIYGLQMGALDAIKVAGEVWNQQGVHLEKADVYRTAIEGKKGEIIRIPFRALQVEDALFRTIAERAKAHEMAVDRIVKEGLHPETAEGRAKIVEYTENPGSGLSEPAGLAAVKIVQETGAEAVFAQRLGPRLETVQRAMAGHPVGFIIPFFRTPVNLVSWAVQHTPGLNLMSGRWREDFAAGGERRARALARVTIGSGLALTAFSLAQDGAITGGGLFDKEQRGTKAAAGWQPYSLKIGDKYYSYQRMEPVAKLFGVAADLNELLTVAKDEEDKAKIAGMLVLLFGNATVSTTYMSGMSNALQSVTDPTRYGENFLEQYASSTVPKIVGQSVATVDPYKREVDGVLEAIQSQLPFLREKLLPKRDVWGEPQKNDKWFAIMPVQTSIASTDKVKTEAMRLQVAIADAPKYIYEKGPFNPSEQRIELSAEQRDIARAVAGKNAMELLRPIVNAPDWENIPDFAKASIYKRVIEGTRKQGRYAALPPQDAERVRLREQIVNEIIKQTEQ